MEHQTCKVCGRRDKFNFSVPDEIWKEIVPLEYQNRVVCLSCFDDFAKEKNVDYSNSIDILLFVGDKARFTFRVEKRRTVVA